MTDLPEPAPPAGGAGLPVSDVDQDERLARHGLVSTRAVAEHYGITPPSARRLLSDHGITEVRGYPASALDLPRPGRHPAPGPGRGHRKRPPDDPGD
jgi:hypothetical protein